MLSALLGACAAACWLFAAVNGLRAAKHRAEGVSLSSLALNGLKFFDPANFTEEGRIHLRRFQRGFVLFFVSLLLLGGTVVFSQLK